MRSFPAFLAVAAAVTLTPGPAFALLLQVAAVHGRRTALANIAGNSVGVLIWGVLSAAGISALVAASQVAYGGLRGAGALFLLWLGVRALRPRGHGEDGVAEPTPDPAPKPFAGPPGPDGPVASAGGRPRGMARNPRGPAWRAARKGLINSLANPKLALFFIALFPQFVAPGAAALPAALAMASVIVACDVVWYGSIALLVDRFRQALRPRVMRSIERVSGAVLVGFGLRLATESR
jgi:threonine/homoserine/homoserine lactone efflux protein